MPSAPSPYGCQREKAQPKFWRGWGEKTALCTACWDHQLKMKPRLEKSTPQLKWAWADGSVSKGLVAQIRGPEFNPQHPHKKTKVVVTLVNAALGRQRQVVPQDSLAASTSCSHRRVMLQGWGC